MHSWKIVPLHDISLKITKGTTPTTIGRPFRASGVNFIKAEALNGDSELDENGFSYIDEDTNQLLRRSVLQENDVLITIAGAKIGKCGYVKTKHLPANTNQAVGIVRLDIKKAVPRFVYYFFKNAKTYAHIQSLNAQAAQPNINLETLGNLKLCLPPYQTQNRIAEFLSAYDDLIENNRRRIQLLEQSARLIYKEWFVRLRFPGHEHVKIKDGVPEGWKKRQVKHLLAKVQRPIKIKTADYLPFATIPCIDQSRDFIGGYTDKRESIIDLAKPVIVFGDHTRILKFVDFPFACGADGTQLIVSNDESISQVYLYFALIALDLSNYFYARHFKFLKDQYIPIPATNVLNQFTEIVGSIMKQVENLRALNQQLTRARDILLPRLMNGEIAV